MTYFLSIYRNEYIDIGGMNEEMIGYAGQDNHLVFRLQLNGLKYYKTQARMVHLYHSRSIHGSGTHFEEPSWLYNYNLFLETKNEIVANKNKSWGEIK
jgi:hypothetical protein